MKAILVEKHGGPEQLVFRDHQIESPGPGRVNIKVHYAGVNFPDTLIIRGKYQFQPDLPFTPGGEVAGVVSAVGPDVTNIKVGDRVVSGTSWGGFAEEAQGFANNSYQLPEAVSFKDAAAVLMTHGTVIHALKDRAKLQSGETLAVLGAAGGVGTAAIQLGKSMGAKVIACASTDEKLAFCKELGADYLFKYTPENLKEGLKELTEGKGADVIFDAVGGAYAEPAFRGIAPMGRYLVVGFASGAVPAIPWNLPLLKSASITGVFWGSFFRNFPTENRANIDALLKMLEEGLIIPQIDEVFPLSETRYALEKIESRQVKGKVLIEI
ncbi:MAG: NADPH:quinone oxidoreductase family protein [Ekhidna sp.]|nr:NADPH:quinone oxidoreductase family protein [Ekhidna sp.]